MMSIRAATMWRGDVYIELTNDEVWRFRLDWNGHPLVERLTEADFVECREAIRQLRARADT